MVNCRSEVHNTDINLFSRGELCETKELYQNSIFGAIFASNYCQHHWIIQFTQFLKISEHYLKISQQ